MSSAEDAAEETAEAPLFTRLELQGIAVNVEDVLEVLAD